MKVVIPCGERPVIPAEIIVLAVGVVVAALGTAHFIAAEQHRRALGKEEGGQKVPLLPGADGEDLCVGRRAFMSVIAGDVVVGTVSISLTICPVDLVFVGDEVAQGEAVVGGDKVDAGVGLSPIRLIKIRGAGEPIAHVSDPALVAAPEVAGAVAVLAVPL